MHFWQHTYICCSTCYIGKFQSLYRTLISGRRRGIVHTWPRYSLELDDNSRDDALQIAASTAFITYSIIARAGASPFATGSFQSWPTAAGSKSYIRPWYCSFPGG